MDLCGDRHCLSFIPLTHSSGKTFELIERYGSNYHGNIKLLKYCRKANLKIAYEVRYKDKRTVHNNQITLLRKIVEAISLNNNDIENIAITDYLSKLLDLKADDFKESITLEAYLDRLQSSIDHYKHKLSIMTTFIKDNPDMKIYSIS